MTFSITWGLLARMDAYGIVSAEHFNVLYRQPQFYSSSTGTTLKGHGWILASSPEDEARLVGYMAHVSWSSLMILSGVQMSVSS